MRAIVHLRIQGLGIILAAALERADARARLGLEVRDRTLCLRDLYDLMGWTRVCPQEQAVQVPDGFYRITAYTSAPPSGIVGDDQLVSLHLEPVGERPALNWRGVPDLSGDRP